MSLKEPFSNEFNISFGYPRKDTCSICDEFTAKIKNLQSQKANLSNAMEIKRIDDIKQFQTDHMVHKIKADLFYKMKQNAKLSSRLSDNSEAICFDIKKNLFLTARQMTYITAVSYTHLDVYKRQRINCIKLFTLNITK